MPTSAESHPQRHTFGFRSLCKGARKKGDGVIECHPPLGMGGGLSHCYNNRSMLSVKATPVPLSPSTHAN